ncbi:MAG: flagellar basal body rod protein FlgC [Pseudomonadota bacterium]|jgi:flagellar basal-body rod protein FlgC
MDYAQVFEISASGMQVQKARLEVAAHNLANANTIHQIDGTPYQPKRVISQAGRAQGARFLDVMESQPLGGALAKVVPDLTASTRLVHEPGHPNADANGMVRYPGVNHLEQMMSITEALRAYEANVAALSAAKAMAARALEIGGSQ